MLPLETRSRPRPVELSWCGWGVVERREVVTQLPPHPPKKIDLSLFVFTKYKLFYLEPKLDGCVRDDCFLSIALEVFKKMERLWWLMNTGWNAWNGPFSRSFSFVVFFPCLEVRRMPHVLKNLVGVSIPIQVLKQFSNFISDFCIF